MLLVNLLPAHDLSPPSLLILKLVLLDEKKKEVVRGVWPKFTCLWLFLAECFHFPKVQRCLSAAFLFGCRINVKMLTACTQFVQILWVWTCLVTAETERYASKAWPDPIYHSFLQQVIIVHFITHFSSHFISMSQRTGLASAFEEPRRAVIICTGLCVMVGQAGPS